MSQTQSVVLLSGGLDSSYNLWRAHRDSEVVLVLTFDYGQKAARKEVETSAQLAQRLGLAHQVVHLPWFDLFTQTALVKAEAEVPKAEEVSLTDLGQAEQTAQRVWVPNRNGIFLNIAAGFAEGLGAEYVVVGFNREEAVTFPDNSQEFIWALNQSLLFSTASQVKVRCYSTDMDKSQIVSSGHQLGLPFSELWPCYLGGESICGQCESCQRYLRALKAGLPEGA